MVWGPMGSALSSKGVLLCIGGGVSRFAVFSREGGGLDADLGGKAASFAGFTVLGGWGFWLGTPWNGGKGGPGGCGFVAPLTGLLGWNRG